MAKRLWRPCKPPSLGTNAQGTPPSIFGPADVKDLVQCVGNALSATVSEADVARQLNDAAFAYFMDARMRPTPPSEAAAWARNVRDKAEDFLMALGHEHRNTWRVPFDARRALEDTDVPPGLVYQMENMSIKLDSLIDDAAAKVWCLSMIAEETAYRFEKEKKRTFDRRDQNEAAAGFLCHLVRIFEEAFARRAPWSPSQTAPVVAFVHAAMEKVRKCMTAPLGRHRHITHPEDGADYYAAMDLDMTKGSVAKAILRLRGRREEMERTSSSLTDGVSIAP